MEIEIQKQIEVPLLNRQRVSVMVTYDGGATPSILQFKDIIASQFKIQKDLIYIRHVDSTYGFVTANILVHIYKTREELLRLEKLKKVERKQVDLSVFSTLKQ